MDPLDLELAVAEGKAMFSTFRKERGLDANEEVAVADVIVSLLHAARAAGRDARDVAADAMAAVGEFWTEAGKSVEPPVNARLSCNLRGRLDAVERAAVAGDDREARRELLALLRFFPRSRP